MMSRPLLRFHQLDTLRFVFAVFVATGHAQGWQVMPKGALAVDFFFVLSGFVLAYMIAERRPGFTEFSIGRFARLWPLHIATLIPFALLYLNAGEDPAERLGISFSMLVFYEVTLLQGMGFVPDLIMNFPSWSISTEFWLNLVLFYWVVRFAQPIIAALIAIACFVVLAVTMPKFDHAQVAMWGPFSYGVIRCTAGLMVGYLLYTLFQKSAGQTGRLQQPIFWGALQLVLLGGALWSMAFQPSNALGNALVYAALTLSIFLLVAFESPVTKLLSFPVLAFFGKLSFAVYLIHIPLLVLGEILALWQIEGQWTVGRLLVFWSALLSLSAGSYYLLEMPARRLILKALNKAPKPPPAGTAP